MGRFWFSFQCSNCKFQESHGLRHCAWCWNALDPTPQQIQRGLDFYFFLHSAAIRDIQLRSQQGHQKHYVLEPDRGWGLALFIDPAWVAICTARRSKALPPDDFLNVMKLWNNALEQWRKNPTIIRDEKLRWRRWDDITFSAPGLRLRPRYLAGYDKTTQILTVAWFDGGDWCGYIPAQTVITPLTSSAPHSATLSAK
jgi:hypothetical protein